MALGLAGLAALGLVLEVFVMEEVLFSRCKYEIRPAIDTFEDAILKLRHIAIPRYNVNCMQSKAAGTPDPAAPLLFDFPA